MCCAFEFAFLKKAFHVVSSNSGLQTIPGLLQAYFHIVQRLHFGMCSSFRCQVLFFPFQARGSSMGFGAKGMHIRRLLGDDPCYLVQSIGGGMCVQESFPEKCGFIGNQCIIQP